MFRNTFTLNSKSRKLVSNCRSEEITFSFLFFLSVLQSKRENSLLFFLFRSEIRKIMVLKFELLTFRRPPIKFLFFCSKFQNGGKKSCFFVGKKSICFLRIFSQNESRVFSLRSSPTFKFPFSVVMVVTGIKSRFLFLSFLP